MRHRLSKLFKHISAFLKTMGVLLLLSPLLLYAVLAVQRPPQTHAARSLFQGITYERSAHQTPRPYMLHFVTIDLTAPGISVLATPGNPMPDGTVTAARTTSEFVAEFDLQLAINASYFFPFREKTPWDYYPHSGDRVRILGQNISGGIAYSEAASKWTVLCISADRYAQIVATGTCPTNTREAVAGRELLLFEGQPVSEGQPDEKEKPYPRTAVAIDKTGQTLWLIVVDGKQPLYSEGVTLTELAKIVQQLGADTAVNLDGGGSATLVAAINSTPVVLNAPIHTKIPMRERPVANHLGFKWKP